MITSDTDAWIKYPQHRDWFNKLWVSQKFNYICGPNAVPVPKDDTYIVRPIYNLHGMGSGARFEYVTTGDINAVPPGYFWCEKFTGKQYTIELTWNKNRWNVVSVFQGLHHTDKELFRFSKWIRADVDIDIPEELNVLGDCDNINVETVGDRIIEVHLRGTPDPAEYSEFIPIWSDMSSEPLDGYTFVPRNINVFGTNVYCVGFYCR